MKVLVVCSYKSYVSDGIAPFIKEQVETLRALKIGDAGLEVEYYLLHGKGVFGYLKEIPTLRKKMREFKPDVIHAHFGLCGLLANIATRRVPVVVTYHGSDINDSHVYKFSKYAIRLSAWNIFVSRKNMEYAGFSNGKKCSLISCGVDDTLFVPMEKGECRRKLQEFGKWKEVEGKKYVLFTKQFFNIAKDYPLAKAAIERLDNVELLEFIGYTREESVLLINAVDALLMTSKTEGSPQVIKEAMACGCPIVSVDVGDVKERINCIDGCYVAQTREPEELAKLLRKAFAFEGKTNGREVLTTQNLSNQLIAKQLIEIYQRVKN